MILTVTLIHVLSYPYPFSSLTLSYSNLNPYPNPTLNLTVILSDSEPFLNWDQRMVKLHRGLRNLWTSEKSPSSWFECKNGYLQWKSSVSLWTHVHWLEMFLFIPINLLCMSHLQYVLIGHQYPGPLIQLHPREFKGESVVAAILPSLIEVSYCTFRFFIAKPAI